MTTMAREDVSLVWLASGAEQSLGETLSAVCTSCADVGEAIFVGPAHLHSALESLPRVFAKQRVVTCDAADVFSEALNREVAHARSPYLLLITRALSAEPGWLECLRQPFESNLTIAVTTPQFIAEDQIAAAGSVVWADGTCEAFGAGLWSGSRECAFRRQVPAVPPHCMLIRSASLRAVGGFHSGYRLAEYAVADLCFSFRSQGLRAKYQPRTAVRIDPADTVAREQGEGDRVRLRARWGDELRDFPERPVGAVSSRTWLLARDAIAGERILVVDDRVVGPDRGSGDPRMFAMLDELVTLWPTLRVTLVAMSDLGAADNARRLQDKGIEVAYGEYWPSWFHERLCHYGIVLMSRPQPAMVEEWIRSSQPQAFRVYDAEALVFRRLERMLPLVDAAKRAELTDQIHDTRAREIEYLAGADEIFCVSHEEQRVARAVAAPGTPVFVFPFCVDIADSPPGFAERRDLVYFGGFMAGPGSPNEDAVLHLASDVLPLIRERVPDVVLHVVGADPTPALLALESEKIHVVGYVEDPRTWLDRVRVHLVPMRFGAGLKQKLVDTIAAGLPFVTTPVGAEGLRLGSLARLTVADTPQELAELTLALYLDANRWTSAQQQILKLAPRHGRRRFRRVLAKALSRAGIGP
jgi:glycosyltransferase involved in cell wall biosynthesis